MPIVDNVVNLVRSFNDRSKAAKVDDAIRQNWMTAPDEAIKQAIQIDPQRGFALQDAQTERTTAADKARRERLKDNTDTLARFLRGAPEGSDYGQILDQMSPFLKNNLDIGDDEIAQFKQTVTASPGILAGLDDDSYKEVAKDRYSDTVATPGAYVRRGGKTVERVPYAPKAVVVRGGDGSSEVRLFNPNEYLSDGEETVTAETSEALPSGGKDMPAGSGAEEVAVGVIQRVEQGRKAAPKNVQTVTQSEARAMQQAWGGGAAGKERFQGWAQSRGVRVVPDGSKGAPGNLPIERVQPAPSMRAAPQSGDRIGAPTAPKPQKKLRAATPQEIAAAGYPQGTAAQIDTETGELKNLRTPPAALQPKPKTAAQEYKEMRDQETYVAKMKQMDDSFGALERDASRLLRHPGMAGGSGNIEGRLPGILLGQDAVDFQEELEALKSNIGLSKLMELKSGSSQGASGLGNLSNAEGERLERAFGTLKTTVGEKVLKHSLQTILDIARKKRAEAQAAIQRGGPQRPGAAPAKRAAPTLGTRIRDKATGRTAILDNSGWVWEDTGQPVGGRKKK